MLHHLIALLVAYGPWIVFLATAAETAAFIGLVVPAEATVLLGTVLAERGVLDLTEVAIATVLGALAGDQVGYVLGRFGGGRFVGRPGGRLGRVWQAYEKRTAALLRRHAAAAITLTRFVSFVRTLMPLTAGLARISYPRYLFFDVLGVLGWASASIAVAYLAAESWQTVVRWFGPVVALVLLLLGILVAITVRLKRHGLPRLFRRHRPGSS